MMKKIGVRELRQNASVYLREVEAGESIEVTDRGRPVALLVPPPKPDPIEEMLATGRIREATGRLEDLGPPLPLPPGRRPPSEVLEEMRAEERY
jgi:prevent-host-death family protein